MGALRGEADDLCGVVDTVAQETPAIDTISANKQGKAGYNFSVVDTDDFKLRRL